MRLFGYDITIGRAPGQATRVETLDPMAAEAAMNPGADPFSPGAPLTPGTPLGSEVIGWSPPVAYNLQYSPTKKPGARNDQLRQLADACPGIRVVIEDAKRQLRGFAWDIVPEDGESETLQARCDAIRALIERPDGEHLFTDWLSAVMEDILVIGATSLGKLRDGLSKPAGLRLVDAANIVPIVTAFGTRPKPPAVAYYWYAFGLPYREYTADELIYRPFNARSFTPYGFSPVEQTVLYATLSLNRALYYHRSYTEGNLPPKFVTLPENWSEDKIKGYQAYLDVLMDGNTEQKHKALLVPFGTDVLPGRDEVQWQYEFDEFLQRIFAWACGVSPVFVTKTGSLGQGSEGLNNTASAGGLRPYQDFVEELIDGYIQSDLGGPGVTFEWVEERQEDEAYQLQEDTELTTKAIKTIDEVRAKRGLEPLGGAAAEALVLTASGYVPLSRALEKPEPVPVALQNGRQEASEGQGGGTDTESEAEEPTEPPSDAETAKADLAKWKRKALADVRKGRTPRPFVSTSIPAWVRNRVEASLAAGDTVTKAFGQIQPRRGAAVANSQRAALVVTEGEPMLQGILRKLIDHYTEQAMQGMAKGE